MGQRWTSLTLGRWPLFWNFAGGTSLQKPGKASSWGSLLNPGSGRTDLSIGHADESLVHQLVCLRVPRLPFHDVTLSCLVGQGDGRDLCEGAMGRVRLKGEGGSRG